MFFFEPQSTPYDVRFRIGRVPVRVHPMFWVVAAVLGMPPGTEPNILEVLLWVAVVFVSILVHEIGHVLAMQHFGEAGHIVLYGFGGLAISSGAGFRRRSPSAQVIISLAGPFAGFAFLVVVFGALAAAGGRFRIEPHFPAVLVLVPQALPFAPDALSPQALVRIWTVFLDLWHVNLYWGLLNLLPILPLDGGQVSRELFLVFSGRAGGLRALVLSLVVAATLAFCCFAYWNMRFLGFFFGLLAVGNYLSIRQAQGGGFGGDAPW